ncbi:MAG TPA: hypothetical protein VGM98_05095 [Schlesneria sp.]
MMASNCRMIKCGLICFWAIWFTVVSASNVCDALIQLGALPATWPFASGNYAAIAKVTAKYAVPSAVLGGLFLGVILWEGIGTVLFWRAVVVARRDGNRRNALHRAFGCGLALMAAFVMTDEVCIVYDLEASHLRLFMAMLVSLLFIELVPDERCVNTAK